MDEAREGIERQAPDVLDRMAASARNIAQRLDDMARDARQRRAEEKEPPPESAGTSDRATEPPGEPATSSGESGTAGT